MEIATLARSGETGPLSRQVNQLVITGGSGGLGQAIAGAFESSDWEIATPGRAGLDVTDPQAIDRYFDSRTVDLLVCAAGVVRDAPLLRADEKSWDEMMAVNFDGAEKCAQAVLPGMIEKGTGHIVFISSYSAIRPPVGQAAYATAKAALLGLTTSLSHQNGSHGIRVNAILPGFLETPMTRTVSPRRKAEILESHHLCRFNTPSAVGRFIHFLHHQLPDTSGQVFQLDSRSHG